MTITINESAECGDTEVIIHCARVDEGVMRILEALRALEEKGQAAALAGFKEGRTYIVEPSDVLYFDTVDKRTFIYTAQEVLETHMRLYELEQRLKPGRFFRASKSSIINIAKIRTIVPDFGGRLEVTMQNGERLFVSRQYANGLKTLLGMRGAT